MANIKIDYNLAMAAGKDAANRSMRANNRTAWNEDDYNEAVKVFTMLMPPPDGTEV